MKHAPFHEQRFRGTVEKALKKVRTILDHTRNPVLCEEDVANHQYDDKYAVAAFVANAAIAAQMNALERLGLTAEKLQTVATWVHQDKRSVTLRFQATDGCTFLKEQDVDVIVHQYQTESETTTSITAPTSTTAGSLLNPNESSTTTSSQGTTMTSNTAGGPAGNTNKTERFQAKVIQKVKEYHWKVFVGYKIYLYCGSDPNNAETSLELQSRQTSTVLITSGGPTIVPLATLRMQQQQQQQSKPGSSPIPESTIHPPIDVNLTWFFQRIDPENQVCNFSIDRTVETCKTPRRNPAVQQAVDFHKSVYDWATITQAFFLQRVEQEILGQHNPIEESQKSTSSEPKPTPAAKSANPLDIGTICLIIGLQKEPTFNGKSVVVREVLPEQDRYRVEPVDKKASGLPQTLLIKAPNLRVESLPSRKMSSSPLLSTLTPDSVFCPVLPLMEQGHVLGMGDVSEFLAEQVRSLDEATENLSKLYPPRQLVKLISTAEAVFVLLTLHLQQLTVMFNDSVDYIEDVLKNQLVQAIGKEISTKDFDAFMKFHSQKLFSEAYAPRPFCYAIRRSPRHYPDGILTIEAIPKSSSTTSATVGGSNGSAKQPSGRNITEPVETLCRKIAAPSSASAAGRGSISIPINAATCVEITGDKYLHGWIQHRFGGSSGKSKSTRSSDYQLACRARQFSSFLLIVGTMTGPTQLDPKDAIILQNKDEVLIPLLTTVLPTAKEFQDAIQSLSPEQRAFAQAFRTMQLESSVFGVAVIQLKPQLETLLGLPPGSLTKEIQLTQDLLSLFVEYQIPSDLLALDDGPMATTPAEASDKVAAVKSYVKNVMDVIESAKDKQLADEVRKTDMRAEQMYHGMGGMGMPSAPSPGLSDSLREMMMQDESESSARSTNRGGQARMRVKSMVAIQAQVAPVAAMSMTPASPAGRRRTSRATPAVTSALRRLSSPEPSSSSGPVSSQQLSSTSTQQAVSSASNKDDASDSKLLALDTAASDDFTMIPKILDAKLEKFDTDNALRSTIIKAGPTWGRSRQDNLLTPMKTEAMSPQRIESEKKAAFDLLDAISRSGTLPIECAELHVVVAVSHCFDNDVMGTIIQDNINPIEKVERSLLMIASTIFGEAPSQLLQNEHDTQRLAASFPLLFKNEAAAEEEGGAVEQE